MSVNAALAQRLYEISQMLEILGEDSFRAAANARAARIIADLPFDIASIAGDQKRLMEIEGIGRRIAEKVAEFCQRGTITEWEQLRQRLPPGLLELLRLPGMGPKTARALWEHANVTDLASLKRALEHGTLAGVPRMGTKMLDRLRAALAQAEQPAQRMWIGVALPLAERIVESLRQVRGVRRLAYAGSLRRGRETVGDLDILAAGDDPAALTEAFRSFPDVVEVLASGETRTSVRLEVSTAGVPLGASAFRHLQADLRIVPAGSWAPALMYFTGSKDHNIRLRERALKRGLTLNEYGLFRLVREADQADAAPAPRRRPARRKAAEEPGKTAGETPERGAGPPLLVRTEAAIYRALGLPFIPPELREGFDELDLRTTPRLIEIDDIRAELHAHTIASDGSMTIEELVDQARRRGFHTIAITDHSRSQAFAGGLSVEALLEHVARVRQLAGRLRGITVLAGSEVDILADGSLDYEDKVLQQLDIVVASPHVALTQDREKATARLVRACTHPLVDILGHATGRLINVRPGLDPDMTRVLSAAAEHGVAVEINAHWHRLDLRDVHARAAVQAGCLLAINCDVHTPGDFDNLRYGVLTARRGWVTPDRCLNAWSARKLHQWLRQRRQRAGLATVRR